MSVITPDVMTDADGRSGSAASGLPPATRVGRVRLQVADLDRSLPFYTGVLGFRVIRRAGDVAVLGARWDSNALVELHARRGARRPPPRARFGLYHAAVLLPARAALARFAAHLAEQGVAAGSADHAVSEAIYLTDPDGLGIEVYADRPRSAWRVHEGELVMNTQPLDVDSLLADAGDGGWSGLPAGTSIGHLHLRVGSLEQAAAFYGRALGFDTTVRSYPGALFFSAGGYHHHLGTNTWAAAGAVAPADEDARLIEWELVLPTPSDVWTTARRVEAAGYSLVSAGDDRLLADPWGTALRLTARSLA